MNCNQRGASFLVISQVLFWVIEKSKIAIIEKIKKKKDVDISEEFGALKDLWKKWIEKQKTEYYPEWVKEFSFPSHFSYAEFIDRSEEILCDLQLEDLMITFQEQKAAARRRVFRNKLHRTFLEKSLLLKAFRCLLIKKGGNPPEIL